MSDKFTSIFDKNTSNVVPGEAVIQLAASSIPKMTSSIPTGPSRGARSASGAVTFGIKKLDTLLNQLGVTSITQLHAPKPISRGSRGTMSLTQSMSSTFRVRFPVDKDVKAEIKKISAAEGVEYAEPVYYRETFATPDDPRFGEQWGLEKIRCPEAWDRTTGSASIIVAVIDTGVDLDHPDLAPLLVQGSDMVDLGPNPTPPPGFRFEGDFDSRDAIPQDEVGHGTHVAGTISCLSNNSAGVAGVTWQCKIMPVKVLTRLVNINDATDVRGTGSSADVAAGIRWAVDHGARVLNLSLGSSSSTRVEEEAIAYAVSQGAVVVAAMGNGFTQGNQTSYPAAYPDVISVGATDVNDDRCWFSQTGPHIDVVAPGLDILSTDWDNGYSTKSGTSMATPHVAGVAALMLSCNPSLTATQVGDYLRQTARPLRTAPTDPVPNDDFGFGLIDAMAAVARACPLVAATLPIKCRSRVLNCPSQLIRCVSRDIRCQTLDIRCRSVSIRCPTLQVSCQSNLIRCQTLSISCRSMPAITCGAPPVSAPVRCPSAQLCPSGPICGSPDRPPFDPYRRNILPSGETDAGWEEYDPYSPWFGEGQEE